MAGKHKYQPLKDVEKVAGDMRHRTYISTRIVATLSLVLNAVWLAILVFQKQQNLDLACSTYTQEYDKFASLLAMISAALKARTRLAHPARHQHQMRK
jgi:hypothetical protein